MIKRIKVHNMNALKDPEYRFPGNYGVEKFLELFSGISLTQHTLFIVIPSLCLFFLSSSTESFAKNFSHNFIDA